MMKLLIAATSGGHLAEATSLFHDVIERADETIVLTNPGGRTAQLPFRCFYHRQSGSSILVLLQGFFLALKLLRRERPDWVLTTGAEVGLFTIVAARLLRIRTVFVETVTRRENPTFAARLSYPFAHHFYVQHPETLKHFGAKARYAGGLM